VSAISGILDEETWRFKFKNENARSKVATPYKEDMMITRRNILMSGLAGAAASALSKTSWAALPQKAILVLGGTGFLGPAFVEEAIAAGHRVTLFNRGVTNPDLFAGLEKIRGNRSAQKDQENLSGLAQRSWDVVVDVWPQDPFMVESAARMLGPRTNHYLYVSSVAAYDGYPRPDINETAPLSSWNPSKRDYDTDKAESERRLRALLGAKLTVVRPGPIMGERGGSPDLFTWLMRARSGGRHIAPGDGTDAVEFVDVKDVGGFLLLAIHKRLMGAFNLTGRSISFGTFLDRCKAATASNAEFVWVPRAFLSKEGLKTDEELGLYTGNFPLWRPDANVRNLFRISSEKAYQAGWQTRTFAQTAHDCMATFQAVDGPPPNWKDYLQADRELQVLADWTRQSKV
jgi:2'-hydroxyisoflavone reductase